MTVLLAACQSNGAAIAPTTPSSHEPPSRVEPSASSPTYASTGTDLGWAQAIPSSASPIGVANYLPMVMCDVTTYDGPSKTVPPLNGNT